MGYVLILWVKFWNLAGDFGYYLQSFDILKTEYSYLEESFHISRRILKESFDILGRNEDTTAARVWRKDDCNEESQSQK